MNTKLNTKQLLKIKDDLIIKGKKKKTFAFLERAGYIKEDDYISKSHLT